MLFDNQVSKFHHKYAKAFSMVAEDQSKIKPKLQLRCRFSWGRKSSSFSGAGVNIEVLIDITIKQGRPVIQKQMKRAFNPPIPQRSVLYNHVADLGWLLPFLCNIVSFLVPLQIPSKCKNIYYEFVTPGFKDV